MESIFGYFSGSHAIKYVTVVQVGATAKFLSHKFGISFRHLHFWPTMNSESLTISYWRMKDLTVISEPVNHPSFSNLENYLFTTARYGIIW